MKDGVDPGASTLIGFDPQTGVGAIVLTNGPSGSNEDAANDALYALFARLLSEGERL
jgi:hypothetical protein